MLFGIYAERAVWGGGLLEADRIGPTKGREDIETEISLYCST